MRSVFTVLMLAAMVLSWAQSADCADQDNVVGTIWSYTATNGTEKFNGQLRVFNLEVFKKAKKIGTIAPYNRTKTTMQITDFPELNGQAQLVKTEKDPPVWVGTLTRTDGTAWKIKFTVKNK